MGLSLPTATRARTPVGHAYAIERPAGRRGDEHAEGANITSASDALWYTLVTISTVGYGDQYPVTNAGRLIGTVVIVVGVGIFGTFTGYLANLFLGPRATAEEQAETDAGTPAESTDAAPARAAEAVVPRVAPAEPVAEAPAGIPGAEPTVAASESAGAASVAVGTAIGSETAERLRVLLAQSEETMAEIRRLLARTG